MKAIAKAALAAASLTLTADSGPAYEFRSIKKMEQNCRTLWSAADRDGDGALRGAETELYLAPMRASDFDFAAKSSNEISDTDFNNACTLGLYIEPIRAHCAAIWRRADTDGDGRLKDGEATPFFTQDVLTGPEFDKDRDGVVEAEEFDAACALGKLVSPAVKP